MSKNKSFLDSSVVRPFLEAPKFWKTYFNDNMKDRELYLSNFVKMEVYRSFITNAIKFWMAIDNPLINNVSDAISLITNSFNKSQLIATMQLIAKLLKDQEIDLDDSRDKEKALIIIGIYIRRYYNKFNHSFKNIGQDSTRCARASIELRASQSEGFDIGFKEFVTEFCDEKNCRSLCSIDKFILSVHKTEIEKFIYTAEKLPVKNTTKGIKDLAQNLTKINDNGKSVCSCKMCAKIGDAVIAIQCPPKMLLEHTDHAFDHLCTVLGKNNRKHLSVQALFNSLNN